MNKKDILSTLNGKRIFLTGATGFIGSHLLKRLIKENCEVHISIRENSSLKRIKDVIDNYACHILDLTDFNSTKNLIKKLKPEIIFHLAAYGVDYRQQDNTKRLMLILTLVLIYLNHILKTKELDLFILAHLWSMEIKIT